MCEKIKQKVSQTHSVGVNDKLLGVAKPRNRLGNLPLPALPPAKIRHHVLDRAQKNAPAPHLRRFM